jgi:hypothetical protein
MILRVFGLMAGLVLYVLVAPPASATETAAPAGAVESDVPPKQAESDADPRPMRPLPPRPAGAHGGAGAGGPSQSDHCRWLGQRIVSLLSRDDAMTAKDFNPFYERFGCPPEHLAEAFGCVVAGDGQAQGDDLAMRVDRCWTDPVAGRYPASAVEGGEPAVDAEQKPPGGT